MAKPLIVVPARGGSVGIPRKAVRLLGGKPVLWHTLETVRDIGHVVVVTNDEDIFRLAQGIGAPTLWEPALIGGQIAGERTLDPVVWWATTCFADHFDPIVTVQCTSPFLTRETIASAIGHVERDFDTALTVRDDRHLRWDGSLDGMKSHAPFRTIRQKMRPAWRETGAVFATRRKYVKPTTRFGPRVRLIETSGAEAVDLDTPEDWAIAEHYAGMTTRELLLAKVLGQDAPPGGVIVHLSCYGEPLAEGTARLLRGAIFSGRQEHPKGEHTYAEAETTLDRLQPGEHDIILVTSAYHQLRVFLTFLRVLQQRQLDRTLKLWNAAAPSPMGKLHEEWEKIVAYQGKGHVATYDDGLAYLEWRDRCDS